MARELKGLAWHPNIPIEHWNGITREGRGHGPLKSAMLGPAWHRISGRIGEWDLRGVVGNGSTNALLEEVYLPQMNICHNPQWVGHGHSMFVGEDGYVKCYWIKCDAGGQPFEPDGF